jgi:hypothetical protein
VRRAAPLSRYNLAFWRCMFLLIAYGAKIVEILLFYFV